MNAFEIYWSLEGLLIVLLLTSVFMTIKTRGTVFLWEGFIITLSILILGSIPIGAVKGVSTYSYFKIDRLARQNGTTVAYFHDGDWVTSESAGIYNSKDELLCIEQKTVTNMYGTKSSYHTIKRCRKTGKKNELY